MNKTTVERKSEREMVTTRTVDGPAHLVFEAWTKPELVQRWWVPKSTGMTLQSCSMDVRVGGKYRLVFLHPAAPQPVAFFGSYLEVKALSRLVWTNEESADAPITTLTFEEIKGQTLLVMHELYPTKAALDGAIERAEVADMTESFSQLDELLLALDAV